MDKEDLVRQLSQEMELETEVEKPEKNGNHYISATGTLLTDADKLEREKQQRQQELDLKKAKKEDPWEMLAGSLTSR